MPPPSASTPPSPPGAWQLLLWAPAAWLLAALGQGALFAVLAALPMLWDEGWSLAFFIMGPSGTMLATLGSWLAESGRLRRSGGARIVRRAGGRLLDEPGHPRERRLLSVVEEVALGADLPRPEVYVLEREDMINSLVCGWRSVDLCLAVTRGALERLQPDELKGLVAHEFGRIRHGDARLFMHMTPVTWGLLRLHIWGRALLTPAEDGRAASLLAALLGSVLLVLGAPGRLGADLLNSRMCRHRARRADLFALKYTRSRDGLGNVLRKIWFQSRHAPDASQRRLHHAPADLLAPMLLHHASGSALPTHPPLSERVRQIFGRERSPLSAPPIVPTHADMLSSQASAARSGGGTGITGGVGGGGPKGVGNGGGSGLGNGGSAGSRGSLTAEPGVVHIDTRHLPGTPGRAASHPLASGLHSDNSRARTSAVAPASTAAAATPARPPAAAPPVAAASATHADSTVPPTREVPTLVVAVESSHEPAPQPHQAPPAPISASDRAPEATAGAPTSLLPPVRSAAELRVALLACFVIPGQAADEQLWRTHAAGLGQAPAIFEAMMALSETARVQAYDLLLTRFAGQAAQERRSLADGIQRLVRQQGRRCWARNRLRWQVIRHRLHPEPGIDLPAGADSRPGGSLSELNQRQALYVATFTAFLSHLVPAPTPTGEISAQSEDWYYTVMSHCPMDRRLLGLPPDVSSFGRTQWDLEESVDTLDLTGLDRALWGLQELPGGARAHLLDVWVHEAQARSDGHLGDEATASLYLAAMLLNAAPPAALAARLNAVAPTAV